MTDKYIHINCDNPDCTSILHIPLDQKPGYILELNKWITKIENNMCVTYCNYHKQGGWWEVKK